MCRPAEQQESRIVGRGLLAEHCLNRDKSKVGKEMQSGRVRGSRRRPRQVWRQLLFMFLSICPILLCANSISGSGAASSSYPDSALHAYRRANETKPSPVDDTDAEDLVSLGPAANESGSVLTPSFNEAQEDQAQDAQEENESIFGDSLSTEEEDAIRGEEISILSDDSDGRGRPEMAILFLFFMLMIGCLARLALEKVQRSFGLEIPSSGMLLIIGMLIGAGTYQEILRTNGEPSEPFTVSLMMWTWMDPRLILFMFLPALIFENAMCTDYFIFRQQFVSGLTLAGPGMLLQILLIAAFGMFVFPYGWGLTESLLFGSILSATDPVAVIALMKEMALLSDLRVLFEAESLLNDGTAIVVFELCIMTLLEPSTNLHYMVTGIQLTFGAPLLGLLFFIGMRVWLQKTAEPIQVTIITVVTTYFSYFVAEAAGANVSGVLTVLTVGILMSGFGLSAIKTEGAVQMLISFWSIICWVAETVIFVLAGVIIMQEGFLMHLDVFLASDWGYLFALYFSLLIIRATMIAVCSPVMRYTGNGMQARVCPRDKFLKYMAILSWGGLRGAVGLVLALVVSMDRQLAASTSDPKYCNRVLCHVAGIVFLTTIVNASTIEMLIHWSGLTESSDSDVKLQTSTALFLKGRNEEFIKHFENRHDFPELASVDWSAIHGFVGFDVLMPKSLASRLAETLEDSDFNNTCAESNTSKYVRGRYLTALRCSYTSQTQMGLLSGLAHRQMSWCINMAIDHLDDEPELAANLAEDGKHFEWGWLVQEGFLGLPGWMMLLQWVLDSTLVTSMLPTTWRTSFFQHLSRRQHARCIELLLAVMRAHAKVLESESEAYGEDPPLEARQVMQESHQIQTLAENEYARFRHLMPDITAAVHTRQTCQSILTEFDDKIQELNHAGQLSQKEFAYIHKLILTQRRRLLYHLPRRDEDDVEAEIQARVKRLAYYMPDQTNKLADLCTEERHEAHGRVLKAREHANSMYIIDRGMLRLGLCEGSWTLKVTLKSAKHLPKMDWAGTCDPFASFKLGEQKFKSKVIKSTYMPEWNEVFVFDINPTRDEKDHLRISVWDWDMVKNDELVGTIALPVSDLAMLCKNSHTEHTFHVMCDAGKTIVTGHDGQATTLTLSLEAEGESCSPEISSTPSLETVPALKPSVERSPVLKPSAERAGNTLIGRAPSANTPIGRVSSVVSIDGSVLSLGQHSDIHPTVLLGDGCSINDVEFLLDDAGFRTYNVDTVTALTNVTLLRLRFSDIRKHPSEHALLLENMWRHAGKSVYTRCPELFDYAPLPADFPWESAQLRCFEKDVKIEICGPGLLVQGALLRNEKDVPSFTSSHRSSQRRSRKKGTGSLIEAFKFLGSAETDGFTFTVHSDGCRLLVSQEATCKPFSGTKMISPIMEKDGQIAAHNSTLDAIEKARGSMGVMGSSGNLEHWLEGRNLPAAAMRSKTPTGNPAMAFRPSVMARMRQPFGTQAEGGIRKQTYQSMQMKPIRQASPSTSSCNDNDPDAGVFPTRKDWVRNRKEEIQGELANEQHRANIAATVFGGDEDGIPPFSQEAETLRDELRSVEQAIEQQLHNVDVVTWAGEGRDLTTVAREQQRNEDEGGT